jgi:hypothetical protein
MWSCRNDHISTLGCFDRGRDGNGADGKVFDCSNLIGGKAGIRSRKLTIGDGVDFWRNSTCSKNLLDVSPKNDGTRN